MMLKQSIEMKKNYKEIPKVGYIKKEISLNS
jgi:hypothetical protein